MVAPFFLIIYSKCNRLCAGPTAMYASTFRMEGIVRYTFNEGHKRITMKSLILAQDER